MQRLFLLSPIGIALFPVLNLATANANLITLSQLIQAAAIVFLVAGSIVGLVAWVSRSIPYTTAVTTIAAILFFSYGWIYEWLTPVVSDSQIIGNPVFAHGSLMALAFAILVTSARKLWLIRERLGPFQVSLAVTAFVALAPSLFTLAGNPGFAKPSAAEGLPDWLSLGYEFEVVPPLEKETIERPDIYYIILDGYSRHDTLMDLLGFDNSDFLAQLEDRGFFVARESHSNYALTFLSLASSLNLRYVNDIGEAILESGSLSRAPFYSLIQEPVAAHFLKSKGYQYVTISTLWSGTETSPIADHRYEYSRIFSGEFSNMLSRTTMLRPLVPGVAEQHLFTFEKLAEIPLIAGPTFSFTHFILPHSPYVFDRNGGITDDHSLVQFAKPVTNASTSAIDSARTRIADLAASARDPKNQAIPWAEFAWPDGDNENPPKELSGYLEQVRFVNRKIIESIDHIIANSPVSPVIILQGDHGTATTQGSLEKGPHPRERMPILNAYRVPDKVRRRLHERMTPVNTFRVLFSSMFDADFPRLADASFYSWYGNTYLFREVPQETLGPKGRSRRGRGQGTRRTR